jgi:C_GCAxxG_C_C family probable redox protein
MTREERARELFHNPYNCAQAVAVAFSADTGIDEDTTCRMMTAFGAGGGRRQFCCGAVSGALLVISLLKGRGLDGPQSAHEETYALAREFFARFEAEHGSSECRTLLDGINLLTPEGQERFKTEDMGNRCENHVCSAVRILESMLDMA